MKAHHLPMVYRLSDLGRQMLWSKYQCYGYKLSDLCLWRLALKFGPIARWSSELTLGQIEDTDPAAGREIAHVFHNILNLPVYTVPRQRFEVVE